MTRTSTGTRMSCTGPLLVRGSRQPMITAKSSVTSSDRQPAYKYDPYRYLYPYLPEKADTLRVTVR
eukprot:scaffold353246_cov31-Prasinocladus_malaysianus.AAC.1